MYICICNAVTEGQVKACVESGACTLDDVALRLGVGCGCGRCRPCATQVIDEARAQLVMQPA